jgi:hypothetical protein
MKHDEGSLHLLAVLYYFAAGLFGFLLVVAVLLLAAGIVVAAGGVGLGVHPVLFGMVMIVAAVAGILVNTGAAIIFYLAAGCLAERCHYNVCVVASAVSCLFFPPGTILGVYALSVLTRPGVRAMFGIGADAAEEEQP